MPQHSESHFRTWAAVGLTLVCLLQSGWADEDTVAFPDVYWPTFPPPAVLLRTVSAWEMPGGMTGAEHFMVQSAAGLAARSVLDGTGETMVWIEDGNPNYERWYTMSRDRLGASVEGPFAPWPLVRRLRDEGLIAGYILYRRNTAVRDYFAEEPDGLPQGDLSANVATSLCALYDAVMVEEALAARAEQEGLSMLLDVRGRDQAWCLEQYGDRLNPTWLFIVDPKVANLRDLCVATGSFVGYGRGPEMHAAHAWAQAGRPIMGWNLGDEFKHTIMATRAGQFNSASNWAMNLPVLSAVQADPDIVLNAASSRDHLPDDGRSWVAIFMSDGDNVQWTLGDFFERAGVDYWGSPARGSFPVSWSSCPADLEQVAPVALAHMAATQSASDDVMLYGGGYYYPDEMPVDVLRAHARRLDRLMHRRNVRVLGYIVASNERGPYLDAMRRVASEMTALDGIVTVRYAPYTGGNGEIDWVETKDGREIPVIAATWALWADLPIERNGTPEEIAQQINAWAANNETSGADVQARTGLVVAHAWSYFQHPDQPNITKRGLLPVQWLAERLGPETRVVTIHELCRRLGRGKPTLTAE